MPILVLQFRISRDFKCIRFLMRVSPVTVAAVSQPTCSDAADTTCIGHGFRKEYSPDWPYWLSAVATTRRLRISLTSFIGLMRRNHGIDYGPVPVHAWSFREPGSAPLATDQSFRVTVARAWNSLPTSITALTSLPSFKRQLKTFLFTKSFLSV